DPPVADFADPVKIKIVELDEACRRQQVGEGWFPSINDVPRRALTLTVPAIMECKQIISVVPDGRKADAVQKALEGPISTACPASILRTHPKATLFLDKDSASKLAALA
ncbi:MAG: glucosamine-6-phosphate deaminase, partial [Firmicutes bacterium]|nr:glucosamine-6-phosphate deaminase [Bacillota bacterium]